MLTKCTQWEKVFVVLGNTEYKNGISIRETEIDLNLWQARVPRFLGEKHKEEGKIVILGRAFTRNWAPKDKSFLVVGSTLWSDVHEMQSLQDRINNRTKETNNKLHQAELRTIRQEIEWHRLGAYKKASVLVITYCKSPHHSMIISCFDKNSMLTCWP